MYIFCGLNLEEALANDVCSVLQREHHNRAAEFVVKDHFEFDVPNDFLVMGKDWRSIKGNSLVKAASIKESQTIYRCAAILISLFNMTTIYVGSPMLGTGLWYL
ncbi:hypothetical protein QQP08_005076 [Theobroma cacao]|nr:hypothetical protein QQP08_005076 [Theobroma cacao]